MKFVPNYNRKPDDGEPHSHLSIVKPGPEEENQQQDAVDIFLSKKESEKKDNDTEPIDDPDWFGNYE
ncbi:MAG: hypothetical protein SFU87_13710 [Chitinophagaceae bacterium]|nr:hypothetical protein [Chitinophagaceae bacterium]